MQTLHYLTSFQRFPPLLFHQKVKQNRGPPTGMKSSDVYTRVFLTQEWSLVWCPLNIQSLQLSVSTRGTHDSMKSEDPSLLTHNLYQPSNSLESQIKDTCLTLFKLVLLRFISAEVLFIHKTSSQCPRDSKENSTLKTEFICWLWAEWKLHLEIQWKRHLNLYIIFFFLPCSDRSTKVKAYKTCKGWFGALLCFVLVLLLFLVLMMENILFL